MNWVCNLSGLNCIDLQQAISDVQLQLNVTLVFLGLLVAFIIIFGAVSKLLTARQHRKQPQLSKLDRMGWRQQPEPIQPKGSWWSDYWQGISTEFFGAVVTTILLGLGVLIFEQYQDIQNRKADLILQMGSDERVWAVEAVRQLSAEGWLTDGTLTNADLFDADLTNANLRNTDLTNAELVRADLTNADLRSATMTNANLDSADLTDAILVAANLTGAYLFLADMTNADLFDANLTNANLFLADMTNANLFLANLTGAYLGSADLTDADLRSANLTDAYLGSADLTDADLRNAFLTGANFTEETILPDGANWTPDTDMARFTDPEHPDFWDICIEATPTSAPSYCD